MSSSDKGKPQTRKPSEGQRPSSGEQSSEGTFTLPTIPRRSPYPADPRLIDRIEKGWKPGIFRRKASK